VVPDCYLPRSLLVGLVLVVTVVTGWLRRLACCFALSCYSTDICSGFVYVRYLHYYYYCYYCSYSDANFVQTLLVVVTVLVLMVGTAFVVMHVEFATGPMLFALCIPRSISIGCDTVNLVVSRPLCLPILSLRHSRRWGALEVFWAVAKKPM
jgi:hypothetical protein